MTLDYVKNKDGEFVCQHQGCSKCFKRQNTMYYHMKRHTKDYTYVCAGCDMGFLQKSAYLHHMAAIHAENKEVELKSTDNTIDIKVKNPYVGMCFKCPVKDCPFETRTKANALVHYARLHSKDWIPSYNKEASSCPHCKKAFASAAAYLYHATGCIPTSRKLHCDMISRITESA